MEMGIRIGVGKIPMGASAGPTVPTVTGRILSDGLIYYRKITRDEKYCIDYSDDGGSNWTLDLVSLHLEEDTIVIGIDDSPEGYRDLIRDGAYVIDQELTPTGFDGDEDSDWVQVYYLKPE